MNDSMILLFIIAISVLFFTLKHEQMVAASIGLVLLAFGLTLTAVLTVSSLAFFFIFAVLLMFIHF
jgi:hypothetical protein